MTQPPANDDVKCNFCNGTGLIADYVGLEMKPVGIDCDKCKGTGKVKKP